MNRKMTELLQNMPKADSAAFLEDARREAKTIQIPQTAWCKAHGFKSEKEYKAVMAGFACGMERLALLLPQPGGHGTGHDPAGGPAG